jgi:hypothetical protein
MDRRWWKLALALVALGASSCLGQVVPDPAASYCRSTSDCPGGYTCQYNYCVRGVGAGCSVASDCPPGYACSSGYCYSTAPGSCASNSDCQPGWTCLNYRCFYMPPIADLAVRPVDFSHPAFFDFAHAVDMASPRDLESADDL